jgi:hypothetical protein
VNETIRTRAAHEMSKIPNLVYRDTRISYRDDAIDLVVHGTTIPSNCHVYSETTIYPVVEARFGRSFLRTPNTESINKTARAMDSASPWTCSCSPFSGLP